MCVYTCIEGTLSVNNGMYRTPECRKVIFKAIGVK